MAVMYILKMLADLALYYGFALSPAHSFGGGGLLVPCVLQSLCCGMALASKKGKWLWLLPMGLCFLVGAPADRIAAIPAALYAVYQVIKGTAPELERQREIFSGYKKLLPLMALVALVLGGWSGLNRVAPFVLLMLGACVALMRALRHTPQVYCRGQYLWKDLGLLAALVAAAVLLCSPPVAAAAEAALDGLVQYVIRPVLMFVAAGPIALMQLMLRLMKGVVPEPDDTQQDQSDMEGGREDPQQALSWEGWDSRALETVFWIAAAAAAVVALILLFRWLERKRPPAPAQARTGEGARILPRETAPVQPSDKGPVQSIRRHYRRYLKRYAKEGLPLDRGTTSADVLQEAQRHPALEENARPIRELYIRARYAGKATPQDAKTMAGLCARPGRK